MRRYLPIALIAAVALIMVVVLAGSGGDDKKQTTSNEPAKQRVAEKAKTADKPATQATEPTQKVSGPHNKPVPILMYHVTKSAPAGTPFPELWVSPADFKGQMQWLADNGYSGITMKQLFDYWDEGWALPKKPIVISFDDGYPSHAKVARPVLQSHKWPGVLFLELSNVGSPKTGLTHSMINQLIAAGWEIDSHTVTHPDLTKIGASQLETELVDSKAKIKKQFGQPAEFFCYPAGKYNDVVVAATKAAGYKGATTVDEGIGKKSEPYTLKRVRIDGGDGVSGFAAKLQSVDQ